LAKQVLVTGDEYEPHKGQLDFHLSDARFRVLACGRRWGKDYCTVHEAIKLCFPTKNLVWWVAPQYSQTKIGWDMALTFLNYDLVKSLNRSELCITFINGSELWFKSADNPDALRGRGIDFLVIDEAATVKREAWENALRPSLSDTSGKAVFISTPKGHNWFFELWTRGNDPQFQDYKSWKYPTEANPYIPKSEIEEAQRTLPDNVFRQEYMAEFLENVGSVFRNVRVCIRGAFEEAKENKHYVMGADLAKHQDFTVCVVLDDSGHLVAFDRFSELDWVFQRKRLVNLAQRYNARLLIDSTGVGDPIYDELRREQIRVDGYKFTSASKADLIENLSMRIENQTVSYPEIPELINELELFTYTMGQSGTIRYSAPEGYHDDCVISLALATWLLRSGKLEVGRAKIPW